MSDYSGTDVTDQTGGVRSLARRLSHQLRNSEKPVNSRYVASVSTDNNVLPYKHLPGIAAAAADEIRGKLWFAFGFAGSKVNCQLLRSWYRVLSTECWIQP